MASNHEDPAIGSGVTAERSAEVAALLDRVAGFLYQGRTNEAMRAIVEARVASPWVTNASGVCELRRGNAEWATQIFRGLAVANGGVLLRPEAPTVFKANLAAALLASGNLGGCLSILSEIRDEAHPAVQHVRQVIAQWKVGFSLWQKLSYYLGGEPAVPLPVDVQLGNL